MKILYIGYALEKASGVTTFVEHAAKELRARGHEVRIVDVLKDGVDIDFEGYDIAHLHCLWQLHAISAKAAAAHIPVVYSTHGMTAPWSMRHKRWKKLLAWHLFQKRDLRSAALIHCTTAQELGWNRAFGFDNCFIAPLGTDMPSAESLESATAENILLFVGRIYPVKGLENLIRAWKIAFGKFPILADWKLRIVGPDEAGYLATLQSLVAELSLGASVEFTGAKYGADLESEYMRCGALVLPSFTENFGATVADAMAHAKCVIASTFTPWREVAEQKCGWWVGNEPETLAGAIGGMVAAGEDGRREMGRRARKLVEEKYSWPAVAQALEREYTTLLK